jgi:hypothetical protein
MSLTSPARTVTLVLSTVTLALFGPGVIRAVNAPTRLEAPSGIAA